MLIKKYEDRPSGYVGIDFTGSKEEALTSERVGSGRLY